MEAFIISKILEFFEHYNGALTALSTIIIAIFTIVLASVTRHQGRLLNNSINIARDEFVSSHPPEIIVRRVSLDQGTMFPLSAIGRSWKIQYVLANVGRSKAIIFEGNTTVKIFDGPLPAIPPFEDVYNLPVKVTLDAGVSVPLTVELDPLGKIISRVRLGERASRAPGEVPGEIYFFGYFQYRDNIGIVRRTAFCRKYEVETERFAAVCDADYEYRD